MASNGKLLVNECFCESIGACFSRDQIMRRMQAAEVDLPAYTFKDGLRNSSTRVYYNCPRFEWMYFTNIDLRKLRLEKLYTVAIEEVDVYAHQPILITLSTRSYVFTAT